MKTKSLFTLIIIAGAILSSCRKYIVLSDNITKEQRSYSGYHSLDVSNAFKVFINFSETEEKIEIEANENLHKYIIVEKVSDNLIIRLEDDIDVDGDATMNVYITSKRITDYEVSGASRIFLKNTLFANSLNVELSGASLFTGNLEVNNFTARINGTSKIDVIGSADFFSIYSSGASQINGYEFVVENLDVKLSGASSAKVSVNKTIDAEISGTSYLYYRGTGEIISQRISGASEIRKMD